MARAHAWAASSKAVKRLTRYLRVRPQLRAVCARKRRWGCRALAAAIWPALVILGPETRCAKQSPGLGYLNRAACIESRLTSAGCFCPFVFSLLPLLLLFFLVLTSFQDVTALPVATPSVYKRACVRCGVIVLRFHFASRFRALSRSCSAAAGSSGRVHGVTT